MPYLPFILGRLRTSASSASIGSEMTARKTPSSNDFLSLAGKPNGLSREETQILVSITALTATLCFPDLFYGLGDVGFYLFCGILCGLFVYLLDNTVKAALPFIERKNLYGNFFMLFYLHRLEGLKNTIFKNSIYYFRHIAASFFTGILCKAI